MARLMAGETATLLATDPPYLVDYDGTNHPADHHKKAGRKDPDKPGSTVGNHQWDEYKDPEASVEFFSAWLRVALPHCIERVPVYQWHASRRSALVEQAWEQNGLLLHQQIIWAKPRGVLTRSLSASGVPTRPSRIAMASRSRPWSPPPAGRTGRSASARSTSEPARSPTRRRSRCSARCAPGT